jgi:hypothetical protein
VIKRLNNHSSKDVLNRFQAYKALSIINEESALHAIRYSIREVKEGQDCILVVENMDSFKIILDLIIKHNLFNDINVLQKREGHWKLNNNELRILTKNISNVSGLVESENPIIIDARQGDPDYQKAIKILDM